MSTSRVKYQKQFFPVASFVKDSVNGIITITTESNHGLFTGIPVTITSGASYDAHTATITVTSANTFTIGCNKHMQNIDNYCINGFISGQTGPQAPQTLPRGTGCNTVIQSYVTGSGGASYSIDLSLNNDHWITLSSITHPTTSGNTQFVSIAPGWAYMRANLSSIGANTNLVLMTSE
jgi:hypothetical protein